MKHSRPEPESPGNLEALKDNGRHLVRILATTDLHMNLDGYDYCADRPSLPIGLTRLGPLIEAARNEAADVDGTVLTLDNGDGLQGTPMADVLAERSDVPHPLMRGFEYLGYSALGLGNHDFNFGMDALVDILEQAACPIVATNMRWTRRGPPSTWRDHVVIERSVDVFGEEKTLKIGLLGLVPHQVMVWDSHLIGDQIEIDDMLNSARFWVPKLKDMGCDLVIVLAHAGLGVPIQQPEPVDILKELADIDGVSAIIGGHTHKRLPGADHSDLPEVDTVHGSVRGVPTVMAGHSGAYLGQIDLILDGTEAGWRCEAFMSRLLEVSPKDKPPGREDPHLRELIAPSRKFVREELSAPVGQIAHHIHGYFGSFSVDSSMDLIARSSAQALRNLLRGTKWRDLPILAAISPQGASFEAGGRGYSDIPAGPVSLRHLSDLCAFPDALNALVLRGKDLSAWLEHSATIFERVVPGKHRQQLLRPSVPPYEFDVIFGLNYRIDPSKQARYTSSGETISRTSSRILDLEYAGQPVEENDLFVVALSSYRANGGGNIEGLRAATQIEVPRMLISDTVRAFLKSESGHRSDVWPTSRYPWQFAPLPDTSVIVETGHGALIHLDEIKGMTIRSVRSDLPGNRIELTLDFPP